MEYKVFNLIKENPAVTYAYITDKWIRRNNGRKCGNWVIMKK